MIHARTHINHLSHLSLPADLRPVTTQRSVLKPSGLWYSCYESWEKWCSGEEPSWLNGQRYSVEIDTKNMLVVRDLVAFTEKYAIYNSLTSGDCDLLKYRYVDWAEIAKVHSGIEIPRYHWRHRHDLFWYYGWNCASGCIWDTSIVKSMKLIAPYKITEEVTNGQSK